MHGGELVGPTGDSTVGQLLDGDRDSGGGGGCAGDRRASRTSLDCRLRVAVGREPLHVDLGDVQLIGDVVRVLDGRCLRQTLAKGRLFPQHLG